MSNEAAMGMMVVSNGSTTRTSRRPQLGTLSAVSYTHLDVYKRQAQK